MEKNAVNIEFEALPENQSFARAVAAAYISVVDPTLEEMTEVKTAVSEAVSNAIIHGYGKTGQGRIAMEMKFIEADRVWIRITDWGCGITDVEKARQPMYSTGEDMELSGMGFTVMESFSDKVLVESEPGVGTSVTLIKCLDTYYDL